MKKKLKKVAKVEKRVEKLKGIFCINRKNELKKVEKVEKKLNGVEKVEK